jgi:hypothetical protein
VWHRSGSFAALLLIAAVAATLVGCAAESPPASATYWRALSLEGAEVESFDRVDEMARASDLVTIGTFGKEVKVRMLQGDAIEDQVFYGQFVFAPESERGSSGGLIVEFLLPSSTLEDANAFLDETLSLPPEEPVLVFLHEKRSPGEEGLYRLITSMGMWVEEGGTFYSPLTADDGAAHDLLHSAGDPKTLEDLLESATDAVLAG